MSRNLYTLVSDAKEELRDWANENPDETEAHDRIFEIADSSVPVYHSDLIDLASEHHDFVTDEPELGPASGSNFDGTNSPINIIAANVFEYIESELWDEWRTIESERAEAELEAE
jgi:hypothetical protein